jgi:hypothetical protein
MMMSLLLAALLLNAAEPRSMDDCGEFAVQPHTTTKAETDQLFQDMNDSFREAGLKPLIRCQIDEHEIWLQCAACP